MPGKTDHRENETAGNRCSLPGNTAHRQAVGNSIASLAAAAAFGMVKGGAGASILPISAASACATQPYVL